MSLVSTCVQSNDGNIYRNPVLSGDDFFICFDDDDPPELVIKVLNRSDTELHKRALDIIKDIGLHATLGKLNSKSGRLFNHEPLVLTTSNEIDPVINFAFFNAYSIFLCIKAPIPVDSITRHDGICNNDELERVIYKWIS